MTRTVRRSVLTGMGALALAGCARSGQASAEPASAATGPFDLSGLERRNGGRLGLTAFDTGSGRLLGWREQERFVYCSTFKMYLAAA